jgi:hypothetical protein
MIFEGSEDKKYKKAIVWSPVAIGDEAFADNFGGFMIFCQLPDNLKKEKLRSVNVAFRFERTYNLEPTVDIEAGDWLPLLCRREIGNIHYCGRSDLGKKRKSTNMSQKSHTASKRAY